MNAAINWLEAIVSAIPLPLLEVWGRFSYLAGLLLAVCAYGGFTFRIGERWGFGRERQRWDAKAFLSMPLTFVLIIASGYVGSFIVLVPGAQTFESLKDLVVLLCIVLFGRARRGLPLPIRHRAQPLPRLEKRSGIWPSCSSWELTQAVKRVCSLTPQLLTAQ